MVRRVATALVLTVVSLGAELPARASIMDAMITRYCLAAVNSEVQVSGNAAPAGMPEYTCDCVVQEMKMRRSQQQAKATCKSRTVEKYNL